MKSTISRLLALLMAAVLVFSLAACGKEEAATTAPASATEANATTDSSTTGTTGTTETGTEASTGTSDTTTTGKIDNTTVPIIPTNKIPSTKAEILAAYTALMNKAKTDAPAYKKKEFQTLPEGDSYRHFEKGKTLIGILLNLGGLFMTKEEDAKVEQSSKGSDMKWFPVYKSNKGCLLSDTSAIKSAVCAKLPNGNYKITIVLNDENNPEPYKEGQVKATSNHGNMFGPLAKSEIDNTIVNDSKVNKVVRNANYKLTYYDCTAELVYNPATNRIVSLNQIMNVKIFINEPTKVGLSSVVGWAVLKDILNIWDVSY